MFVISDPESPYLSDYSEEIVLSLSDWYHRDMTNLLGAYDLHMQDPTPESNLINDTQNQTIQVKPGTTYLVRVANIGAYVGHFFWVEDHTMRIVEVDGVYTAEKEADVIYLTTGQRYSFLLTTKTNSRTNFPIVSRMDPVSSS